MLRLKSYLVFVVSVPALAWFAFAGWPVWPVLAVLLTSGVVVSATWPQRQREEPVGPVVVSSGLDDSSEIEWTIHGHKDGRN